MVKFRHDETRSSFDRHTVKSTTSCSFTFSFFSASDSTGCCSVAAPSPLPLAFALSGSGAFSFCAASSGVFCVAKCLATARRATGCREVECRATVRVERDAEHCRSKLNVCALLMVVVVVKVGRRLRTSALTSARAEPKFHTGQSRNGCTSGTRPGRNLPARPVNKIFTTFSVLAGYCVGRRRARRRMSWLSPFCLMRQRKRGL